MSLHTIRHFLRRFSPDRTLIDELAVGFIGVLLIVFWYQVTPAFTDIRYTLSQSEEIHQQQDSMFFSFDSIDAEMKVHFLVREGFSLRPSLFTLRADDCLGSLVINGKPVPEDVIGGCVIDTPKDMALGQFFHEGINEVTAVVPDTGGRQGFSIRTAHTDPLLLSVRVAILLVFTLLSLLIIRRRIPHRDTRWIALLFLFGVLLRLVYFDVTPYDVRSNDADGHMDYIRHVSNQWTIPATGDGWQFYHPPLYYFVAAPLFHVAQSLHLSYFSAAKLIQFLSVIFSVGILGACLWISHLLFEKRCGEQRCLWIATLAVFPGMILFAPTVNNDALVQFLGFLAVALSLRFWQMGDRRGWVILIVTIALGMLTKMNMIVFLPVAFGTLLFHPDLRWRTKVLWGVLGLLILLSLTEWMFILRIVKDSATSIVGNIGNLNDELKITNSLSDYLTFNPWEVLRHPFANPWEDSARRMIFFEFLYRSAFFGEFDFSTPLRFFCQLLLTLGLFLGVLACIGMTKVKAHWRRAFPIWLTFIFVLLGHVAFRYSIPFSSSENFRYSLVLVVPMTYFILLSVPQSPRVRSVIINVLWCFVVLSAMFVLSLSVINPL